MNAVAQGITKTEFSVMGKVAPGATFLTNRSVTQEGKSSLIEKGLIMETDCGTELTGFGEKIYTSILLEKRAWLVLKDQEFQAQIDARNSEHREYMERMIAQYKK